MNEIALTLGGLGLVWLLSRTGGSPYAGGEAPSPEPRRPSLPDRAGIVIPIDVPGRERPDLVPGPRDWSEGAEEWARTHPVEPPPSPPLAEPEPGRPGWRPSPSPTPSPVPSPEMANRAALGAVAWTVEAAHPPSRNAWRHLGELLAAGRPPRSPADGLLTIRLLWWHLTLLAQASIDHAPAAPVGPDGRYVVCPGAVAAWSLDFGIWRFVRTPHGGMTPAAQYMRAMADPALWWLPEAGTAIGFADLLDRLAAQVADPRSRLVLPECVAPGVDLSLEAMVPHALGSRPAV